MIDFKLPNFNGNQLDDAKERKQIKEYLVLLAKQLKYILNNIDVENLSAGLSQSISDNSKAVQQMSSGLQDMGGAIARVEKNATQLSLSADNKLRSCVLSLKLGDTTLGNVTIQFTGNFVTEEQLAQNGVSKLTGATGTFSSLSSASGSTQLDGSHVTSAKLFATGVATAQDGETYYPVYIKSNGELIKAAEAYSPAEGG